MTGNSKTMIKKITIIGDGGWGTALAIHLAQKEFSVNLWGPFPDYLNQMRRSRYNSKFLPGIAIPKMVTFVDDLSHAIKESDLIVFAIPSKYAFPVLKTIKGIKADFSKKIFLRGDALLTF